MGDYSGVEKLSPHDLRRTAITRALDQGLSYRQVPMMSGHRDPKTVLRYDHNRKNVELNAINLLLYEDESKVGESWDNLPFDGPHKSKLWLRYQDSGT